MRFFIGVTVAAIAAAIIVEAAGLPQDPYLGMSERGRVVGLLIAGGPADRAGLRVGDEILEVNGRRVTELTGLTFPLRSGYPGQEIRLRVGRGGGVHDIVLVPQKLPPPEIAWGATRAAAALIALFVGSLALIRRRQRLTVVFSLICLALSLLLFHPYIPPAVAIQGASTIVALVMMSFFPALFLHFFILFPYERPFAHQHPGMIRLLYLSGFVIAALGISVMLEVWPPDLRGSIAFVESLLVTGAFAFSFVGSVWLFVSAYRRTALPTIRRKLTVALWSTIAGVVPIAIVLVLHSLLPGRGIPVDRAATIALVLLPIGFGYAIVKHGVFDIERMVKRSLVVTGVTAILILTYFVSYFLLQALLHTVTGLSGTLISVLAFLFVIILFSPIRGHIQNIVDRSIYPERYQSRRRLREFARSLPLLPDEGEIVRASLQGVARALGVERGAYFPEGDPAGRADFSWGFEEEEGKGPIHLRLGRAVREPVLRRGETLLREEVEAEVPYGRLPAEEVESLTILDARVLAPISTTTHRFGIAVFGSQIDEEGYSQPDLEIFDFLATQTALAMENAGFQRELRRKEALARELEIARTLQRQLLPQAPPDISGVEMTAATLPCREVGGDYFDYVQTEGRVSFAIGDVCGKGVPAALLMANVQALFRAESRVDYEPNRVLDRMNRRLCEIGGPDSFVSFFTALFDPRTGELRYSGAGHPPPFLIRNDGTSERLGEASLLLGIQEEVDYPLGVEHLDPGDMVLCFTDGIADPDDPGTSLREDQLEAAARDLRHLPAARILDSLLERIGGANGLEDDTTILVLKTI